MMVENCNMNLLKEKVAALEEEVAHLRSENLRLQKLHGQGQEPTRRSGASGIFPALEAILDASIEVINVFDIHGNIVIANAAMARRFNCSTAELVGRNIYDLFPPDVARTRRAVVEQVINSGMPANMEDERSGMILLSHVYPIKNPAGTVTHLAVFSVDITSQRQNEKKLLANQALLKTVQDLTHVGGWEWNVATQTMTWTEETYRIHGLNPGDLPEMGPAHIDSSLCCYDPEDRPIILAAFNRCIEHGEAYDLEFPLTAANGRRLFIRTIGKPIWDGNRVAMVRGNIADVTERRENEELLKARLRLSEAAATTSLDNLLRSLLDETERLTASRIGFLHFYDEASETISLQAWSTATEQHFCKIDNKRQHYSLAEAGVWADCIRSRRPLTHNDYGTLPNRKDMPQGHARITRELVVPVFNNNAIVAVLGIGNKDQEYGQKDVDMVSTLAKFAWDIVLRKRAESALRQGEEKYRNLASLLRSMCDNVPDMIWAKDLQKRYIFANKALCRGLLNAADTDEPLGKTDLFFALRERARHPDNPTWHTFGELCQDSDQITLNENGPRQFDEYGNVQDQFLFLDVRKAPFIDETGQTIGTVGSARDITAYKKADEALHQSLAEKEVLLREVHHRVKNNMAAIIGLFDMQRLTMEDGGARTILGELSSRVRAMSLVHEKLYRSESLTNIDFQEYTESLVSHLRTSFGSPTIECRIDAREVAIPLDLAVPCGMIINELVTNCLKYAFPKTIATVDRENCSILVVLSCRDNWFSLTVADNGVGWSEDFEWRTAKSLGLTLVRMLGEHQLGGSYSVDRNNGIRFTLTFSPRPPSSGRKTHD